MAIRAPAPAARRRAGLALLSVLLVAAPGGAAGAGPRLSRELGEPVRAALARAGRLVNGGSPEAGFALLDSLAADGVARGDTALRLAATIAKGGQLSWTGDAQAATRLLPPALRAARARGDSSLEARGAMWLGHALITQGRLAAAESLYQVAVPVAAALRDAEREGFMRLGLAYIDLLSGRAVAARRGYAAAGALLRAAGNGFGEIDALTGLGRAHDALGELDLARACYERVAALARAAGFARNEADALNNIGANEFERGDPAAGLRAFAAAQALHAARGSPRDAVTAARNSARGLLELGRLAEAGARLDSLLAAARAAGYVDIAGQLLNDQAELRLIQGRPADALRLSREVTALPPDIAVWVRLNGYLGAAGALAALDSLPAALALLTGPAQALRPRLPADWALQHDALLGRLLLRAGRPREAGALARRAAAEAGRLRRFGDRARLLGVAAECALRLGDPPAALSLLDEAAREWERARRLPPDPEWRERRGRGQELCATVIEATLQDPRLPAAARPAAAFDAAQRFKGRTLAERAHGRHAPADSAAPTTTVARLRRDTLRDGELLLDLHAGRDASWLFVVSGAACRVTRLPGEARLQARLSLLHDLLAFRSLPATADADTFLADALRQAAALVLGPAAPDIRQARRVIVSPDGPLYLAPFGLLIAALDSSVALPQRPSRLPDVARVPSAALFAQARLRAAAPAGPARGWVVAVDRNGRGQPLRGARAEAAALTRRHPGLRLWRAPADSAAERAAADFAACDLVHFATHTELDDQRPWRSGVLLAAAAPGRPAPLLRAERIADRPSAALLAVLASCESAGGVALAGEGLQGLTSAFMAAGVPTLVATLWPVEDRAAARLMARFYARLGAGRTVGEALREAKLAAAAVPPGHGAPPPTADWAGFVLVGDPDLRLVLPTRRGAGFAIPLALTTAILAAVLAPLLAPAVRRRARLPRRHSADASVTTAPRERPTP